MAVRTVFGSKEIPKNAVRLNEEQALKYQQNLVRDWENQSEVLFLKYGRHIAALIGGFTSVYACFHAKSYFNIQRGFAVFSVPAISITVIQNFMYFDKKLTNEILLMKKNCPLCTTLYCSGVMILQSVVYPAVLGTISAALIGNKLKTYISDITDRKEMYKLYWNCIKAGSVKFQGLALLHVAGVFLIAYMQNNEVMNLSKRLHKISSSEEVMEV